MQARRTVSRRAFAVVHNLGPLAAHLHTTAINTMASDPWCSVQSCSVVPGCAVGWSRNTSLRQPLADLAAIQVQTCFNVSIDRGVASLPAAHTIKQHLQRDPDLVMGSHWVATQIGPFTSHGGYDWWDVKWNDAARLSMWLKQYHTLAVARFMEVGVDATGQALGFPPIHLHHSHTTPGDHRARDALSWLFRGSGDQQCGASAGGIGCQGEILDPYVKRFDQRLSLWVVLNDVRPHGSPMLTWWYQASFLLKAGDRETQTVSQLTLFNPWSWRASVPTSYYAATYVIPADDESFLFFSGGMPLSGSLVRVQLFHAFHAHMQTTSNAFLFSASPDELSLRACVSPRPKMACLTAKTGFGTNSALRAHLGSRSSRMVCWAARSVEREIGRASCRERV